MFDAPRATVWYLCLGGPADLTDPDTLAVARGTIWEPSRVMIRGLDVPGAKPMNQLDDLLTAQELAEYLGVPIATLYAWRYRGDGPASFRVGRHLRYRAHDVETWIRSRVAAREPR